MEEMIHGNACRFKSCFYMNQNVELCGRTRKSYFSTSFLKSSNKKQPRSQSQHMVIFIIQQTTELENSAELRQIGGRTGRCGQ